MKYLFWDVAWLYWLSHRGNIMVSFSRVGMSKKQFIQCGPLKMRPLWCLKIVGINCSVPCSHINEEWRHQLHCWEGLKIHISEGGW